MHISDIMDLINEVEAKFPVDEWVIRNVHIWPLVRLHLFFRLFYFTCITTPSEERDNKKIFRILNESSIILKGMLKFTYAYYKDYEENSRPDKLVDTVFLSDGTTYDFIDGAWYEKFCDPFISRFNKMNASYFLMSPLSKYFIPRKSSSMFIQPWVDYITIKSRFFKKEYNSTNDNLVEFEHFINFLESKRLPIKIGNLARIIKIVHRIIDFSGFFKDILRKIKPALGFVVCYYDTVGMAFNLACRDLGIPSVDIQHGRQGNFHAAYGRWNKIPQKGYELLPSIFWCWSHSEASAIEKWNANVSQWHKPIVGGNLLLSLWQSGGESFIKYYDQKINEIKKQHAHSFHVLYTYDGGSSGELEKLISIIKNAKKTELNYHFWIRLHPGILKQRKKIKRILYNNGFSDVEFDTATDIPLYALLKHVDLHITFWSSIVIEAEAFGVPSIILHEFAVKVYEEQVSSGWVVPANTVDEIISAIKLQLERRELLKKAHSNFKQPKEEGFIELLNIIKENKKR